MHSKNTNISGTRTALHLLQLHQTKPGRVLPDSLRIRLPLLDTADAAAAGRLNARYLYFYFFIFTESLPAGANDKHGLEAGSKSVHIAVIVFSFVGNLRV